MSQKCACDFSHGVRPYCSSTSCSSCSYESSKPICLYTTCVQAEHGLIGGCAGPPGARSQKSRNWLRWLSQAQRGTRVRIRGATFIWGLQFVLERYRAVPLAGLNDLYEDVRMVRTPVREKKYKQEVRKGINATNNRRTQ